MKVPYVLISTLVLVLLSGMPLISSPGAMNYASARDATNTQTQANANDCDTGTNCAINSPQTQGGGSASSPTNLQISGFNEEQGLDTPTLPPAPIQFDIIIPCNVTRGGFACEPIDSPYNLMNCVAQNPVILFEARCTLHFRPPNTGTLEADCNFESHGIIRDCTMFSPLAFEGRIDIETSFIERFQER